jgi:hypothetical protein
MKLGARTPEELETLFEDALLIRDHSGVRELFEHDGVLAIQQPEDVARGSDIARLATRLAANDLGYVAQPRRVLQARDIALVVGDRAVNVAIRVDGNWRYAIALLDTNSGG